MGSGSTKFSLKKAKPAMDIFMVMLVPNVYGFLDWSAPIEAPVIAPKVPVDDWVNFEAKITSQGEKRTCCQYTFKNEEGRSRIKGVEEWTVGCGVFGGH